MTIGTPSSTIGCISKTAEWVICNTARHCLAVHRSYLSESTIGNRERESYGARWQLQDNGQTRQNILVIRHQDSNSH